MRRWIIDIPAMLADTAWRGYWLLIAAGSLICLATVAIILVLYAFGLRIGW